jgi:glutaredoxin
MLTLYYRPSCFYCQDVLREAETIRVSFRLKDISGDEALASELMEHGGKRQVPFLVDSENGINMYESEDIINYIKAYKTPVIAASAIGGLKVHKGSEVCNPSAQSLSV